MTKKRLPGLYMCNEGLREGKARFKQSHEMRKSTPSEAESLDSEAKAKWSLFQRSLHHVGPTASVEKSLEIRSTRVMEETIHEKAAHRGRVRESNTDRNRGPVARHSGHPAARKSGRERSKDRRREANGEAEDLPPLKRLRPSPKYTPVHGAQPRANSPQSRANSPQSRAPERGRCHRERSLPCGKLLKPSRTGTASNGAAVVKYRPQVMHDPPADATAALEVYSASAFSKASGQPPLVPTPPSEPPEWAPDRPPPSPRIIPSKSPRALLVARTKRLPSTPSTPAAPSNPATPPPWQSNRNRSPIARHTRSRSRSPRRQVLRQPRVNTLRKPTACHPKSKANRGRYQ